MSEHQFSCSSGSARNAEIEGRRCVPERRAGSISYIADRRPWRLITWPHTVAFVTWVNDFPMRGLSGPTHSNLALRGAAELVKCAYGLHASRPGVSKVSGHSDVHRFVQKWQSLHDINILRETFQHLFAQPRNSTPSFNTSALAAPFVL